MTRLSLPWTRQGRFLRALAKTACVASAARDAGVDRRTVYRWRACDPGFARRWRTVLSEACERLHDELMERALQGRERIVYRHGPTVALRQVRREMIAATPRPKQSREPGLAERLRQAEARVAPYLAERAAKFPNTDFES